MLMMCALLTKLTIENFANALHNGTLILDDMALTLQSMMASRFVKPFIQEKTAAKIRKALEPDQRESGRKVDIKFNGSTLRLVDSGSKWVLRGPDGVKVANSLAGLESGLQSIAPSPVPPPKLKSSGGGDCRIAPGHEGPLSPAQHVHQAALTDGETEEIRKRALQAFIGQGLEGFEVRRHRMHARPERRPFRRIRHGRDNPRSTGRAAHRQTSMTLDKRLDLGKFDPVVCADRLGGKIA